MKAFQKICLLDLNENDLEKNAKTEVNWLYQCKRINGGMYIAITTQNFFPYSKAHKKKQEPQKENLAMKRRTAKAVNQILPS